MVRFLVEDLGWQKHCTRTCSLVIVLFLPVVVIGCMLVICCQWVKNCCKIYALKTISNYMYFKYCAYAPVLLGLWCNKSYKAQSLLSLQISTIGHFERHCGRISVNFTVMCIISIFKAFCLTTGLQLESSFFFFGHVDLYNCKNVIVT